MVIYRFGIRGIGAAKRRIAAIGTLSGNSILLTPDEDGVFSGTTINAMN